MEPVEATLEKEAARHYRRLTKSRLPRAQRQILLEVFFDWLMQRFKSRTTHEITAMITELTPIEKTVAGRELIGIGLKRGRQEGRQEGQSLLVQDLIAAKFGKAAAATRPVTRLHPTALRELSIALLKMKRVEELQAWLAAH